ncbi:MAG TPA: hypothetical protein VLX31_03025 [Streptosporangiaceae bacterium]|nr:hypothetical protein [Streptosporangiaceae bacterium]
MSGKDHSGKARALEGTLILYCPAEDEGQEIEVSLDANPAGPRTHARVRRGKASQDGYAAVYPSLAAGTYTIWRGAQAGAVRAVIRSGRVTSLSLG